MRVRVHRGFNLNPLLSPPGFKVNPLAAQMNPRP